jgi:hypothetical protein
VLPHPGRSGSRDKVHYVKNLAESASRPVKKAAAQLDLPAPRKLTDGEKMLARIYHKYGRNRCLKAIYIHFEEKGLGNVKRKSRAYLRNLEDLQIFRDELWQLAVRQADLANGEVLQGVTNSAKKGRVDAAKLHLAVTDRFTEKQDATSVPVTVVIGAGIPRPQLNTPVIEGEAEELTDG